MNKSRRAMTRAEIEATGGVETRGFASMSPEKQRAIAKRGGQAAHEKGVAHEWTAEEARAAGRKGGLASSIVRGQRRAQSAAQV